MQSYAKIGYFPLKLICFGQTFGMLAIDLLQPAHMEKLVWNQSKYHEKSSVLAFQGFIEQTKSKIKLCLQSYAKIGYFPLKLICFGQTFGILALDLLQPAHIEIWVPKICYYCNMGNSNLSSTKLGSLQSSFLTGLGYINQLLFNQSRFIYSKLHFEEKKQNSKFGFW